MEKVFIKTNCMENSARIEKDVRAELIEEGFEIIAPIIGINTGHLGFFQEIDPSQTKAFLENYRKAITRNRSSQPLIYSLPRTEEDTERPALTR